MKHILAISFLIVVTALGNGCVLEDVNKLGDQCPGVKQVKLGMYLCNETDTRDAVCSGFIESGVFREQQCPLNYECQMDDGGDSVCNCPRDCGTACCDERHECSKAGDNKCVLKSDEKCLSDSECAEQDESTPYCRIDEGMCVECVSSSQCSVGKCVDWHCVECSKDADCSGDLGGELCVRGKCAECDPVTYEKKCLSDQEIRTCDAGVIREGQCEVNRPICSKNACVQCRAEVAADCPQERPYCKEGDCKECNSDTDCKAEGRPYCRRGECVPCDEDSDCSKRADGRVLCGNSGECVECKTDSDCPSSKLCMAGACVDTPTNGVDCYSDEQCTRDDIGRFCDTDTHHCVECHRNEDCAGKANVLCELNSKKCVECVSDFDCSGKKCNLYEHRCQECIGDSDCTDPSKPLCISGICGACNGSESKCKDNSVLLTCSGNEYKETPCSGSTPVCANNQCVECQNNNKECKDNKLRTCVDYQWKSEDCSGICRGDACHVYQYVRIDDLSDGGGEDPGTDVDAVAIVRNSKEVGYATSVADHSSGVINKNQATGRPDCYINSSRCNYTDCNGTKLFSAIGGISGHNYVIYKMDTEIHRGDSIRVYEVAKCTLYSVDACNEKSKWTASGDKFKVSILTSTTANQVELGTKNSAELGAIVDFSVSF